MSQFATSSWGGRRKPPYAFTQYGVLMLSSVLKSERAIQVNIRIMRIYSRIQSIMLTDKDVQLRLEKIEHALSDYDEKIVLIFKFLKKLEQQKKIQDEQSGRRRIGFRPNPR